MLKPASTLIISALFLLQILVKASGQTNPSLEKIKIKANYYIDQNNRVVLFRGINAVQKSFPWIPQYGMQNLKSSTQLDNLKAWGFNCVRLGVMWSGVYPQKGQLNQTYLDEMLGIVDQLAQRGIYVIIDLHQDMLSSQFGSYDGAPFWLVNSMPKSAKAWPWPFKTKNLVFASYATEACGFAFQCLYNNVNGFQDAFHQFWTTIATQFGTRGSVLAYELINEPWSGDIYKNPLNFLSGYAGAKNLMPLYDNAYDQIRNIDKNTIIMYEPVTWATMSTEQLRVII
jgi:endoglycosylceramidase